jgi:hypothetical protein
LRKCEAEEDGQAERNPEGRNASRRREVLESLANQTDRQQDEQPRQDISRQAYRRHHRASQSVAECSPEVQVHLARLKGGQADQDKGRRPQGQEAGHLVQPLRRNTLFDLLCRRLAARHFTSP